MSLKTRARFVMGLSESPLATIKAGAEKRGMKYRRLIRELLERRMQALRSIGFGA